MKGEDASATLGALRPEHLEQQCLRLLQRELQKLDLRALQAVACVACGSPERRYSFKKCGFTLNKCMTCGTLYISPRLSQDVPNRLFRDSEAMFFWTRGVYPATVPARRNLAARRVRHLQECLRQLGLRACKIDAGDWFGYRPVLGAGACTVLGRAGSMHRAVSRVLRADPPRLSCR